MAREIPLPSDTSLERLVLGAVVASGRVEAAIGVLDTFCFSNALYGRLWAILEGLYEQGERIDRITVFGRARDLKIEGITLSLLAELDDDLPHVFNLDAYVARLKDIGIRRQAILQMDSLMWKLADTSKSSADLLTEASRISDILGTGKPRNPIKTYTEVIEEYGTLDDYFSRERMGYVIPTPWASVQEHFIGFQPGRLYVIAGRPAMGKSAWALQVVYHAAVLGDHPLVVSLEMAREECVNRTVACQSGVSYGRITHKDLRISELRDIAAVVSSEPFARIRIADDPLVSIPLLRNYLLKITPRPKVTVVDYLQLMESSGRTRNDEVSAISRGLKLLAKEMDTAIIALSQMSRPEDGKEEKRPSLKSLRDSGAIEQDADMVGFIWGKLPKDDNSRTREVFFDMQKQRNGPVAKVPLIFDGSQQKFSEFDAAL